MKIDLRKLKEGSIIRAHIWDVGSDDEIIDTEVLWVNPHREEVLVRWDKSLAMNKGHQNSWFIGPDDTDHPAKAKYHAYGAVLLLLQCAASVARNKKV